MTVEITTRVWRDYLQDILDASGIYSIRDKFDAISGMNYQQVCDWVSEQVVGKLYDACCYNSDGEWDLTMNITGEQVAEFNCEILGDVLSVYVNGLSFGPAVVPVSRFRLLLDFSGQIVVGFKIKFDASRMPRPDARDVCYGFLMQELFNQIEDAILEVLSGDVS